MTITVRELFPTRIAQGRLPGATGLNRELRRDIAGFVDEDKVGKAWSNKHYRGGYTSYASLDDMHRRAPSFARLERLLQPRAHAYARALGWRTRGCRLNMTTCWINIMPRHTHHTLHIHPHADVSGTYYVDAPAGSVALRLEDPRMGFYMHAPPRAASRNDGSYVDIAPRVGTFILFESWLRHAVPPNQSTQPRVSVSFNYTLG